MIKSFHVTTPCMNTRRCPEQPTLLSPMGRLIQSLLAAPSARSVGYEKKLTYPAIFWYN